MYRLGKVRLRKISWGHFPLGFIAGGVFFRQNFRWHVDYQMHDFQIWQIAACKVTRSFTLVHLKANVREWPAIKCSNLKWRSIFHMYTLYAIPGKKSKIGRLLKSSTIVQILLAVTTYCCFGGGGTWPAIAYTSTVIALLRHWPFLMTSRHFQILRCWEVTALAIWRYMYHRSTDIVFGKSSMARSCIFHNRNTLCE